MFVIQERIHAWNDKKYRTLHNHRCKTVEEARAVLETRPYKSFASQYRIAEEYTVTRYKAVKERGKTWQS